MIAPPQVGIILAAGKGERLGGPKALLAWPSGAGQPPRPLAIAHAEALLAAGCGRALIVARSQVVKALLSHVRPGIDLVASTAAEALGPAGSLGVAAGRLGGAAIAVVTPVDAAPARAATVGQLLSRLTSGEPAPLAVRPRHNGRGGHPVALRAEALERYLEPNPPPLRDHLRALGNRVADEDVPDASVLVDLDKAIDVLRATGAPPRFLP